MIDIIQYAKFIVKSALRGIGQIMLQESAITGFVYLMGISISSLPMGLAAFFASIVGTITAILAKYSKSEINQGLYGFNAALAGVAIVLFVKLSIISALIIIVAAVSVTFLQHFFMTKKIAAFTLPFVIITWLIAIALKAFPEYSLPSHSFTSAELDFYTFPIKGFGQIVFQTGILSGILFICGTALKSRIAVIYGLVGAVFSAITAYILTTPIENIANGLASYNAVLCAIVFAGKEIGNILWAAIAVFISVLLWQTMIKHDVAALTFPFVAASYITIKLQNKMNRSFRAN